MLCAQGLGAARRKCPIPWPSSPVLRRLRERSQKTGSRGEAVLLNNDGKGCCLRRAQSHAPAPHRTSQAGASFRCCQTGRVTCPLVLASGLLTGSQGTGKNPALSRCSVPALCQATASRNGPRHSHSHFCSSEEPTTSLGPSAWKTADLCAPASSQRPTLVNFPPIRHLL